MTRVNICIDYGVFLIIMFWHENMTLGAIFKMHPLVLVLENRALGIVLNCVVYMPKKVKYRFNTTIELP